MDEGYIARERLFRKLHGRIPTTVEEEVMRGFPDMRGVSSRDVDAWLPVALFLAVWQVFDTTPGTMTTVVIFFPGIYQKPVKAWLKTFLTAYLQREKDQKVRELFHYLGLSFRPTREDTGAPWVSVGYLKTDPIPSWIIEALEEPPA